MMKFLERILDRLLGVERPIPKDNSDRYWDTCNADGSRKKNDRDWFTPKKKEKKKP